MNNANENKKEEGNQSAESSMQFLLSGEDRILLTRLCDILKNLEELESHQLNLMEELKGNLSSAYKEPDDDDIVMHDIREDNEQEEDYSFLEELGISYEDSNAVIPVNRLCM